MKIRAQMAMVMSMDKCIGCHTCSVTCKNTWTNRPGAEYMWWNNVETKPGIGYPKEWENQETHRGGWILKNNKLELKAGGRLTKLLQIFYNPDLTPIDEFYEPWTYNYENLINRKLGKYQPVATPHSQLTGERIELKWGPNWEDDLAGVHITGKRDPNLEEAIKLAYEQVFMFYLPRICEHCLNPSCLASCPSGAIYKREEDGIVLVDQDMCRSWRFCMTGCPYKKVYFNWKTHKAEKCTFCYPRIEVGLPTICSETCVGRIRYIGIILYDANQVAKTASTEDPYQDHLSLFLNPHDPKVIEQARHDGITQDWLEAAQRSPVYKLAVDYQLAFPLHPEYRTLPMVWYIPPLSPMINAVSQENLLDTVEEMRIPLKYLANLLTGGKTEPVKQALKKMIALRSYMQKQYYDQGEDLLESLGLKPEEAKDLYNLLAIAKYSDRYVIPTNHREHSVDLHAAQGTVGLEFQEACLTCGLETYEEQNLIRKTEVQHGR